MSSAVDTNTMNYLPSVNTPDVPATPNWRINDAQADALYAAGKPTQYWKVNGGNVIVEMTQAEKDAVDAANLVLRRDAGVASQLDAVESIMRATVLVLLDEFNAHAAKINAMLTAVDNAANLADLKTAYGAIADYPARTVAQIRAAIRNKLGT
jgi:hypothetical protein